MDILLEGCTSKRGEDLADAAARAGHVANSSLVLKHVILLYKGKWVFQMNEKNEKDKPSVKSAKEEIYDKIPLTLKQVDIITKVLIGILIVVMIYLIFFE